jgi:hypothetical protein
MVYSPQPPYELRANGLLDFFTMQRLRRFARYWDLTANSGVFPATSAFICAGPSPFNNFLAFSDWLYARTGQTHAIARARLAELLGIYITDVLRRPAAEAAALAVRDAPAARRHSAGVPRRQGRRLA